MLVCQADFSPVSLTFLASLASDIDEECVLGLDLYTSAQDVGCKVNGSIILLASFPGSPPLRAIIA